MTPAPGAGSEGTKKKRRRRRPANRAPQDPTSPPAQKVAPKTENKPNRPYTKRVDEVSAGGLVISTSGSHGLLIGRIDQKDANKTRLLWSLPKGHIEPGETPEQAAIREVMEETGIESAIERELGVIDSCFLAGFLNFPKGLSLTNRTFCSINGNSTSIKPVSVASCTTFSGRSTCGFGFFLDDRFTGGKTGASNSNFSERF